MISLLKFLTFSSFPTSSVLNNNGIMKNSFKIISQLRCLPNQQRQKSSDSESYIFTKGEDVSRPVPNVISYLSVPGKTPLLGLTIGELIDNCAKKYADLEAVFVAHQNIRKTFAQAIKEADELAVGFLKLGLKKGDKVGLWSPNCYEWYLTHHALAKAGLVLVSINPAYQASEVLYAINYIGIKCMVISTPFKTQNYYNILSSIIPNIPHADPGQIEDKAAPSLKIVITMEKHPLRGTYSFEEIQFKGSGGGGIDILAKASQLIRFDDLFNIQLTSGTTGRPKVVMLSHHSIVNNSFFATKRLQLTTKDKICLTVPLFHCYGCGLGIMFSIHCGVPIVFPAPIFDPIKSLESIAQEKCTVVHGTTTMHVNMITHQDLNSYDLSSLRIATNGGATLSSHLCQQMKKIYGIPRIMHAYGMTEASPLCCLSFNDDSEDDDINNTTIGYPLEHTEVKIIDSNGQIVPIGVKGELCMRGYMTMLGYLNEPEETLKVLKKTKWLHTGDIMIMLPNGYCQIVGRLKDMIIRGGENISPKEIEEYIYSHLKILEAHVFGVSDEIMGEEIGVWIRLKEGEQMNAQELKDYCKGQIAHYKIPKYVSFRSDFPKTASGKIQKYIMKEIMEKELVLLKNKK